MNYLRTHKFVIAVITILILATFIRFHNFNQHWGLANDDSRDVMIAREALRRHELPVIGSFSSAGPFVFGPLFYWTVMASLIIMPNTMIAPWIIIGIMSVGIVATYMRIAYLLAGKKLSIITGLLATTSPQMVGRALSLGQHSYIALCSALIILNYVLLWQRRQTRYAIYIGFILGIALSMHYQAINVLLFFPALLFVPQISLKKKVSMVLLALLAFIIPSLPIILWDSKQGFANTRNILDYLLIGQYRLYVPNSWKLFLSESLPTYWAFVIGTRKFIAILLIVLTGSVLSFKIIKKQLPKVITALTLIFSILVIVNRYYKGERSEGYLLYLQPFIILLTAYALFSLITWSGKNKISRLPLQAIGCLIFITVILYNSGYIKTHFKYQSPTVSFIQSVKELKQKYPGKKFTVYDYQWQNSYQSQPLSFLLEKEGLTSNTGMPIGLNCIKECTNPYPAIGNMAGVSIYDLSTATNLKDTKTWMNVSQANLYDDLMKWSKTSKLESNFHLSLPGSAKLK